VGTLQSHGLERDVKAVGEVARERGAERVVVGLPIHMNGSEGPEAKGARRFAERLSQTTGLPVDTLDERWTTVEAERALDETGARRKRKRVVVDDLAATILLRSYLEREAR
jgi:putative Holliday junction resolvase